MCNSYEMWTLMWYDIIQSLIIESADNLQESVSSHPVYVYKSLFESISLSELCTKIDFRRPQYMQNAEAEFCIQWRHSLRGHMSVKSISATWRCTIERKSGDRLSAPTDWRRYATTYDVQHGVYNDVWPTATNVTRRRNTVTAWPSSVGRWHHDETESIVAAYNLTPFRTVTFQKSILDLHNSSPYCENSVSNISI